MGEDAGDASFVVTITILFMEIVVGSTKAWRSIASLGQLLPVPEPWPLGGNTAATADDAARDRGTAAFGMVVVLVVANKCRQMRK